MDSLIRRARTYRVPGRAQLVAIGTLVSMVIALAVLTAVVGSVRAYAAAPGAVNLGTTESFSVLGGQTVTNTGPSTLSRNLGVSPGDAITGFPPGTVLGTIHAGDAVAAQAQSDLVIAFNDAAGRASTAAVSGELGSPTPLVAGVYTASSSALLTGTLILDGQNDPNSVFIFQIPSALTTATNSTVRLINGAQSCNVFFQVGSSATIGVGSTFVGNILALTSISVQTGATVDGRALARNGSVTLDNNVFTTSRCADASPSPSPSPTVGPTVSVTPAPSPSAPAPSPSAPAPSLSAPAPSPSAPTPSAPAPSPSAPTPSAPAPSPSAPTPSASQPASPSPTITQTDFETESPSATATATDTESPSATATATDTESPSATATATETESASATPTETQLETEGPSTTAPGTGGGGFAGGSGSGGLLANTGSSGLTTALGLGGIVLLLVAGGILVTTRLRTRAGRHQ